MKMPNESPLRPFHERAGALLAIWFGALLPDRFSDFDEEVRRSRSAVALLDTNFRAVFQLTGQDRVRYLNAITTNDVKTLADGHGHASLLLNPQGHILAEFEVLVLPNSLLILSHASVRERTLQTLDKFIIMDDVTLEDATSRIGTIAVEGPAVSELVHEACGVKLNAMPVFAHREVLLGAVTARLLRVSHFGETGAEFLVEREALPALWQTLGDAVHAKGGGPIGSAAWNSLRLEAGIPWFSYDFDDRVIPHEVGLENSHISYTKGCYTGQEIVERVRSRGQVNRRRTALAFSSAEPPATGTRLLAEGKEAGHVTSAAISPTLGHAIGFGYVRREHNVAGKVLNCAESDVKATIIELPLSRSHIATR